MHSNKCILFSSPITRRTSFVFLPGRMLRLFLLVFICLGLTGLMPELAPAQEPEQGQGATPAEQPNLFDAMQNAYAAMSGMRCQFEQTLTHRESGAKSTRPGILEFKKPLSVRWEISGEEPELIIISSAGVWDYLPEEEVAYRYSPDIIDRENSFLKIITGQANLRQDFEIASEGQAADGSVEYHLYPLRPTQQLTELYIWLDSGAKDGQPGVLKRVRIIDFFGNQNEIRFRSSDLKAKLNNARFQFTPPPGVDVEDNRNNPDPELNLFQ